MVPVAAWIVWDHLETRALARDIAALAARGEPTTGAAIPSGADTQERRHAARVYAAAVEHASALPPNLTFRLPRLDVDSPNVVVNLDELERSYPHDAPYLQLIHQAAPLDFNGFGALRDQVSVPTLTTLGHLCALDADLYSARGRADDAAAALTSCARLWRTMGTLARSQLSQRLLGSTRILLRHGRPRREQLTSLQQAFAELADTDRLADDVRGSRARFLDDIAAPRRGLIETAVARIVRPWTARTNRQRLRTFDEALTLADRPWPQKFLATTEVEERYRLAFGMTVRPAGMDLAVRRTVVATVAVERYRADRGGATPASLDALLPDYLPAVPTDPFSGKRLVYVQSATGYLVYSIDADMKDDGGSLYGLGSRGPRQPQQRAPRDVGIRVEH